MRLTIQSLLVLMALCSCKGSSPPKERQDFTALSRADRIVVHNLVTAKDVAIITAAPTITAAASYIQGKSDGWVADLRNGGTTLAPLELMFYRGNDLLGIYGIGADYLAAGGMYQHVGPDETNALVARLGLSWR